MYANGRLHARSGTRRPGWNVPEAISVCASPRFVPDLVGAEISINHNVRDYSESGVLGDPTVADAEHGRQFMNAIVSELADLIVDFNRWELTNLRKKDAT